jgi:hypothetical protein
MPIEIVTRFDIREVGGGNFGVLRGGDLFGD